MKFPTTAIAVVAVLAGGSTAFAAPADAATGPTVTLEQGVVTVTGTAVRDTANVKMDASGLVVDFGLDGTIDARIPRSQYQQVRVLLGEGDDGLSVGGAGDVPVTISGGPGNDGIGVSGPIGETAAGDAPTTISGDDGNDLIDAATPGLVTILAGAGDDRVFGGGAGVGREVVSLGDGNDRFVSSLNDFAGIRRDNVDGGAGQDTMAVEGSFVTESIGFSGSKGHLVVDHEWQNQIVADNIEDVTYIGFGGNDGSGDAIGVNDLSGTGVVHFAVDFSAQLGTTEPNNSPDVLIVRGTPGVDHIAVSGSKANVLVAGLTPVVTAVNLRPEDVLLIDTLAGDDTVDSSGLQPGLVQLQVR